MPRNGSGIYELPISFTPDTPARAEDVQGEFDDVATALTGSLPRDGQAGMTGQFQATAGTSGAPGISFAAEPSSGIRRAGSNDLRITVGGSDVAQFTATGPQSQASSNGFVPIGVILPFGGSSAPTGYLLCDGSVVSQATYAALFAVIGATYNTGGEGAGNFRLPNMKGRVPVGADAGAGVLTTAFYGSDPTNPGAYGGDEEETLTDAQLPTTNVSGPITITSPNAGIPEGVGSITNFNNGGGGALQASGPFTQLIAVAGTFSFTFGSDDPHPNVQPSLTFNYIIKT